MKKIIFLLLFVGIGVLVSAQRPWKDPTPYAATNAVSAFGLTSDTVAASTTVYFTLSTIYGRNVLSVSPYILNVSGTSGVAFYLQAYIANTWVNLSASNDADMALATGDTITLTTATAGLWTIHTNVNQYRVKCVSDGTTQSTIIKVSYMVKPE